jgi:signal transduction histidine kinase/ActR/RegA family two-component response regulator
MAATGWIHAGMAPVLRATPAALLRGAARGEPLDWVMQTAARELVDAGSATRAGVWLLRGASNLEGISLEAGDGSVPERWISASLNSPEVLALMQTSGDEIVLRGAASEDLRIGPVAPSVQSLWLPLRNAGKTIGLAMVGWQDESRPIDVASAALIAPLRMLADALALAAPTALGNSANQPLRLVKAFSPDIFRTRALEAEALLAGLADSTDSGIVLFDPVGNVRLANDRFAQFFGLSRNEIAETQTWNSLSFSIAARFLEPEKLLLRWAEIANRPREVSWDELELLRPVARTIERFGRPVLDAGGDLLGRLEIYRDVTGQRLVQSKLLQTEKMAGLGQLVSGIAHELNNPLTSIIGYSQLLLGRRLTAPQEADGRLIHQEAERAARIVKNLLLFAREARPERRPVNLNEIVERTLALRNYELRVENIELSQDLAQDLPLVVADAAQLQQVLLNLLVNAEQAIRQGSGEGSIRVRTRKTPRGNVSFEILDSGPGIPQEIIPRIFDPFFSTKPLGAGTGLGLSITCGIVKEHGGDISVQSQLGHGARFIVELPAAVSETAQVSVPPAALTPNRNPAPPAVRAAREERMLVVEDEPTVAHLIADVLGEEGHEVEIVLDGRDGLDRALAGDYTLIICDLRMPHLDGRGIYRELVAQGSPMRHRLIFVTGDTLAPRTLEFLEKSGLPFLAKPFLVEELKAVVDRALIAAEQSSAKPGKYYSASGGTANLY